MKSTKYTKKHLLLILPVLFVIIYIGTITYGVNRPLPNENISYKSELKPVIDPVFLTDLSYASHNRVLEQDIFDYINEMINNADEFVLFDMFLFNNIYGEDENFPALADEMSNALLKKKQDDPNVAITVITDPVSTRCMVQTNRII